MASRSSDGNGVDSKHLVLLALSSAGLGVVAFLLGVMVGRGVSVVDMLVGQQTASGEELLVIDEQPFVASTPRREPSIAADGTDLSYFRRLDDDMGPELDARLGERAAEAPAGTAAPAGSTAGGAAAPSGGSATPSDGYAIQVTTLREGAAAERMAQGLVEKGYPAFVAAPPPDVPVPVFRVRVGTYADREEAERVLRRLEGEESFKPWITR